MAGLEKFLLLCSFCLLVFVGEIKTQYEISNVTIESLWPRGFRVSIPDVVGITSFTFNGKINEEIHGREIGTFSQQITKATGGRWIYQDKNTVLHGGDTIYYWVKVTYFNGEREVEYFKDNQIYKILTAEQQNVDNSNSATTTLSVLTTPTTTETKAQYQIPAITVQALWPKGLRISIPDEVGVQLFSIQGTISREVNIRIEDRFAGNVTRATDGHWTFQNNDLLLKTGDVIYYWVTVNYFDGERNNKYYKDSLFIVKDFFPADEKITLSTTAQMVTSSFTDTQAISTEVLPVQSKKEYQIPRLLIQAFLPRGLKISIPNEDGIQLFSVQIKTTDEEILFKNITQEVDGYWTYLNKNIKLEIGDSIAYKVKIVYFDGDHTTEYYKDGSFIIDELTPTTDQDKKPYQIPDVIIQAFSPRGLRISIPDENGVHCFSVQIYTNEEETLFKNITKSIDGYWTYWNKDIKLNILDQLYYKIKVDYLDGDRDTEHYKEGSFIVNELIPGTTEETTTTTTTTIKPMYQIPDAKVEAFWPNGLRISIPHEVGIQLVYIEGSCLEKGARDEERFFANISRAVNGQWSYHNENLRLEVGDVISFSIKVFYFDGFRSNEYYKNNEISLISELIPINARVTPSTSVRTTTTTTATTTTTTPVPVRKDYKIPHISIIPLWPKGLKISIPDEMGLQLFSFHANINDRISDREEGTLFGEAVEAVDGYWTIVDNIVNLEAGDAIYYWIKVNYFNGYQMIRLYKDNQVFIVKELVRENNFEIEEMTSTSTTTTTMRTTTTTPKPKPQYRIPDINIELLRPRGIRVSIPDKKGIRLFAFHGNVNQKISLQEEGTLSGTVIGAVDDLWTFTNEDIRLNTGDEVYYWVQVDYFDGTRRITFYRDEQVFIITQDKFLDVTSNGSGDDSQEMQPNYKIPNILIEAFWPRGLKVSIPDRNGIRLFAFHGKINEVIDGREEGNLSKDIIQSTNGRWTYFDENAVLDVGDVIYYWVKVDYLVGNQRIGHYKENQTFRITELIAEDTHANIEISTIRVTSTTSRTNFEIPDIIFEAYMPKGLHISIPHVNGIRIFSFHGKVNRRMQGREDGTFSKDITQQTDGRWIYSDKNARLRIGDVIYYWVKVDYYNGNNRVSYYKDNQSFTIAELIPAEGYVPITITTTTTEAPTTTTTTTQRSTTTKSSDCKYTPTIVNGKPSCQGRLIFEENFEELSERKWLPEVKFAGEPDYEFVIYHNDKENLYIENNFLHIRPTLTEDKYGPESVTKYEILDLGENCTGVAQSFDCVQKPKAWLILPPTLSAQISTKSRFSFAYGVVEIRARLPKGDWIYPEIYLKPKHDEYGFGYKSGLIKIAFAPGNDEMSNQLGGGCILGQTVTARNYAVKRFQSEIPWTNDFHVFKVEWKPDSITLSVDDQVYGIVNSPDGGFGNEAVELGLDSATVERWKKGSALAPFDKEMFLILGVGVGGQTFSNKKDADKPWDNDDPKAQLHFYRAQDIWSKTWSDSSVLVVDYVKVWAL